MSEIPHDVVRPNGPDRAAINKANAQKSTGPRTEAGKNRSKLNALRHGLTGQIIVLPTEDHFAYQRLSQSLLDEHQPKGATETQIVQSLIDTSWRMNRAAAVETNLFSLGMSEMETSIPADRSDAEAGLAMALAFREHNRAFAQISIYGQRLARQFERTLDYLHKIQDERRTRERLELDDAANLLKMDQEDGIPYNPAEDGFVFSNVDIETHIHRTERREDAFDRAYAT
jgi:hypothetical protein